MKNKRLVSIIIALIVFAVFGAGSYLFGDEILDNKNINSNLQTENTIVVNYLDVGQETVSLSSFRMVNVC